MYGYQNETEWNMAWKSRETYNDSTPNSSDLMVYTYHNPLGKPINIFNLLSQRGNNNFKGLD